MNKIGVILESFHTDPVSSVNLAAAAGADAVQFYGVGSDLDCDTLTLIQKKQFSNLLSSKKLEISAMCADMGGHGFQIESDNVYKVAKTIRVMEWASSVNCNTVTTHVGVISIGRTRERKNIAEACKRINEQAEKLKVYLAIETGPERITTLNSFLNEIDCEHIKVNYDPANLVMVTGDDPIKGVHILGNKIVHTHAKNGNMIKKTDPKIIYDFFAEGGIDDFRLGDYFKETPMQRGQVDIPKWLCALKEINYEGFLTIERETIDNPFAEILSCVQYLREEQMKLLLNG